MIRMIVLAGMAALVATQTMNAPGQVGTLLAWACRWQQRGSLGVVQEAESKTCLDGAAAHPEHAAACAQTCWRMEVASVRANELQLRAFNNMCHVARVGISVEATITTWYNMTEFAGFLRARC